MKNEAIIASWNKIGPSALAQERMFSAIMARNRSLHENKDKDRYISKAKKTLIPAAACLALLIAVTAILGSGRLDLRRGTGLRDAGHEGDIDGTLPDDLPEGMDPIVASLAVFPEGESLADVADAVLTGLSEEEAYRVEQLGRRLPSVIPDGYRFRHAGLYKTTMKNGAVYYLLSASYSFGDTAFDDSQEDVPDTLDFSVSVLSFKPETKAETYSFDELPDDLSGKGFLYVVYGDTYVGVDVGDLTHEEIMSVLNSVN